MNIFFRSKSFLIVVATILFAHVFASAQQQQLPRGVKVKPTPAADRGIALVIGNAAYAEAPLKNPVNDATDMAAALKTLGFKVALHTNLDQNQMKRQIRSFGEQLTASGAVGLFYYAGHGVQVKGVNYLIPIGAKADSEQEIEYEAVEAGFVLAQMEEANNAANIVILDACRNNPFARSYRSADKGLASINAPSGTLIAYATAPGSVASDGAGRNGLYTQELLKQIKTENLSVEEAFKRVRVAVRSQTANKQTPWESSSLVGSFYFSGTANGTLPPPVAVDTAAAEAAVWDAIKDSDEAQNFVEFIKAFPRSKYLAQAKLRLKRLQSQPASQNPFEAMTANKKPANKKNAVSIFSAQTFATGTEKVSFAVNVRGMDPAADVQVFVNDADVSAHIENQSASETYDGFYGGLILSGKVDELNLKVGRNEVYVTVNKVKSEPFAFKVLENQIPKLRTSETSPTTDQPTSSAGAVKIERVSAKSSPNGVATAGGSILYVYVKKTISQTAEIKVFLNDAEISSLINHQRLDSSTIPLEGGLSELSFVNGRNEVYVEIDGVKSEPYAFNYEEPRKITKISSVDLSADEVAASFVIWIDNARESDDVRVFVNNLDITRLITVQKNESYGNISVRKTGTRSNIGFKDGSNEVYATVNGTELGSITFKVRCTAQKCFKDYQAF